MIKAQVEEFRCVLGGSQWSLVGDALAQLPNLGWVGGA